jgi:hypothetical protein
LLTARDISRDYVRFDTYTHLEKPSAREENVPGEEAKSRTTAGTMPRMTEPNFMVTLLFKICEEEPGSNRLYVFNEPSRGPLMANKTIGVGQSEPVYCSAPQECLGLSTTEGTGGREDDLKLFEVAVGNHHVLVYRVSSNRGDSKRYDGSRIAGV